MQRLEKDGKLYPPPLMPAISPAWHSMHTAIRICRIQAGSTLYTLPPVLH